MSEFNSDIFRGGFKPGFVMMVLEITREQLRYWRRQLDPIPSRPIFSYQMLLCYAVVKELIREHCLETRHLKASNIKEIFHWFEHPHTLCEREQMFITFHNKDSEVTLHHRDDYPVRLLAPNLHRRTVFLGVIEHRVFERIMVFGTNGELGCLRDGRIVCGSMADMKKMIWKFREHRCC